MLNVCPYTPCLCLLVCAVPGNISAGKSTLCRSLADELGYVLYLEPTVSDG